MKPLARFVLSGVMILSSCGRGKTGPARAVPANPVASSAGSLPAAGEARPPFASGRASASESATRFLVIGGGPVPESNEVSLEQDVETVQRALPGPGVVLFAGGSDSVSVRELAELKADPVRLALGDLFAPRAGRQSRYRKPRFSAGRATLAQVKNELSAALALGSSPLLVYIAAHGEQGDDAKHNSVALWGSGALTVLGLAELHEQHERPLRLVATSCFSGGFAELAFAAADGDLGRPATVPRCGLFAGTADRETSGCDPNPNRRAQESYGLHFVHALNAQRKDGTSLPVQRLDYNHDGVVGLLEAHTWARIEAQSFDVPTTTSERWLRRVESGSAELQEQASPEESAVVVTLGAALRLPTEAAVEQRLARLADELSSLNEELDAGEDSLAAGEADLATLLLERWPVIDDPFHPEFEKVFTQNRQALAQAVLDSAEAQARERAAGLVQGMYERLERLSVEEARVLRVARAYETLHKVAALRKRGGPDAAYYEQLLACERAPL